MWARVSNISGVGLYCNMARGGLAFVLCTVGLGPYLRDRMSRDVMEFIFMLNYFFWHFACACRIERKVSTQHRKQLAKRRSDGLGLFLDAFIPHFRKQLRGRDGNVMAQEIRIIICYSVRIDQK